MSVSTTSPFGARVQVNRPRFFVSATLVVGLTIALPKEVAHHVLVRRLPKDSEIALFNGHGGEFVAEITELGKSDAIVFIRDFIDREVELPYGVTIAQAMSASEKMDWTVEKCVELGAAAIAPLEADRSVVRLAGERAHRRHAHWAAIVRAACEQCGRNTLPSLHPLQPMRDFVANHPAHVKLIASPRARVQMVDVLRHHAQTVEGQRLTVVVGPEAGFSDGEEAAAIDAGFQPVSLGPRVLRTETAAPVILAAIQALWGNGTEA